MLEGRFELGESAIATDAECSFLYARFVLGGRFELGEEVLENPEHWGDYSNLFGCSELWEEFRGRSDA